ncbi:MAG: PaaI family thioesterase [Ruminococcaceae bacterium]|nr:PaaI family thioesterase [Oscillospiraceae bacterium]
MADLEKVKSFFRGDTFAMNMGIEIVQADAEESVCAMEITPDLYNAGNTVQGGAIFTLADLAFAVAANCEGKRTVTQNATVTFLKPGTGKKLIATATKIFVGRRTCHYSVRVTNEQDVLVANLTVNGFTVE